MESVVLTRSSPAGRRCGPTSSVTRWSARPSCSGASREQKQQFIPGMPEGHHRLGARASASPTPLGPGRPQDGAPNGTATSGHQRRRCGPPRPSRRLHLLLAHRPEPRSTPASPTCCAQWTTRHRGPGRSPSRRQRRLQRDLFTNARCPVENVVGGVNNGGSGHDHPGLRARLATTTVTAGSCASSTPSSHARKRSDQRPADRQRLATAWSKVKIMEINGYRSLTDALNAPTTWRRWARPTR